MYFYLYINVKNQLGRYRYICRLCTYEDNNIKNKNYKTIGTCKNAGKILTF